MATAGYAEVSAAKSISLKSLVSQCVDLAQRAGVLIREVSDKKAEFGSSLGRTVVEKMLVGCCPSMLRDFELPTPTPLKNVLGYSWIGQDAARRVLECELHFCKYIVGHHGSNSWSQSQVELSAPGMHDKGLGTGNFDPQTIADRQAQRCIVENLRAIYGMSLRVVGEEGELGETQTVLVGLIYVAWHTIHQKKGMTCRHQPN